MTNTWVTAKGAKITLTTEHITSEVVDLDGDKATIATDSIQIDSCTINGQTVNASLWMYQGKQVLNYGTTKINGVTHPLLIAIPAEVYEAVWGEYNRRIESNIKADLAAEYKYQADHDKVLKAMAE
jgi:hypothetical protein